MIVYAIKSKYGFWKGKGFYGSLKDAIFYGDKKTAERFLYKANYFDIDTKQNFKGKLVKVKIEEVEE